MMYKIFLTILLSFIPSSFVLADETLSLDEGYRINLSSKIDDEEEVELDDVKLIQTLVLVGVFIIITTGVIRKVYFGDKSKDPYYKEKLENIYSAYQVLSKRLEGNLVSQQTPEKIKAEFLNITHQINSISERLINILNALMLRSTLKTLSIDIRTSILKIKESNIYLTEIKPGLIQSRQRKSREVQELIDSMLKGLNDYIQLVKRVAYQESN